VLTQIPSDLLSLFKHELNYITNLREGSPNRAVLAGDSAPLENDIAVQEDPLKSLLLLFFECKFPLFYSAPVAVALAAANLIVLH
jgi:hypothetical protein